MDLECRFTGCLTGLAAGDALGAPLEFMSPSQIQIKLGTVREMIGGGWLLLRPGEWTEDTALALGLARSLADRGELDIEDAARRYVEWYRTAPNQATGVLRAALAEMEEGRPASEAARKAREISGEDAEGNGALTRAVPLALFFADRTELAEAAGREAGITHADETARAASAALATVLSFVLEGAEPAAAFEQAFDFLEPGPGGLPNVLPDVPARAVADLRPTTRAIDTLEVSLWHFLRYPELEEAVVRVANFGGDTDTNAAIVGALAGARLGADAVPQRWLRSLKDRSAIRMVARNLAGIRGRTGQAEGDARPM